MALTVEQQRQMAHARMDAARRALRRVGLSDVTLDEITEEWLLREPVRVLSIACRIHVAYRPDLIGALGSDIEAMQAVLRSFRDLQTDEERRAGGGQEVA